MMAEGLAPCPFCGNEHPEIASGDSVICNTDGHTGCGCSAFYDRWNRRVPPPATAKLIRCIKADVEPSDTMLDAFLAEWPDSATPPAPEQPAPSSPWKCSTCGKPVRICDDLRPRHIVPPWPQDNHLAQLSDADLKTLADSLRLSD